MFSPRRPPLLYCSFQAIYWDTIRNMFWRKRKRRTLNNTRQQPSRISVVLKVMNDVVFPTRLDFGVHALGETIRRTVKMVCKVGA